MKKTLVGMMAVAAVLGATSGAQAQNSPISVEVRGGLTFPTGDDMEGIESGINVGGLVLFRATPMVSVFGGYDFNSFGVEGEEGVDAEIKGFTGGLRVNAMQMSGAAIVVQGGVVAHKFALTDGDISIDGDTEIGFEGGLGASIPLGNTLAVTPLVTYTSVDEATYFKASVGLKLSF